LKGRRRDGPRRKQEKKNKEEGAKVGRHLQLRLWFTVYDGLAVITQGSAISIVDLNG